MRTVTSVTLWNDAVGKRMSITYSEIDENTGRIISDNRRIDRVITNKATKDLIDDITDVAQQFVDSLE